MPFETEELWQGLGYARKYPTLLRTPWPAPAPDARLAEWGATSDIAAFVDDKHDLIRAARTLRADRQLAPRQTADFTIKPVDADAAARLEGDRAMIASAIGAGALRIDPAFEPAATMPSGVSRLGTVYMSIEGLVDIDAERAKLAKQIEETDEQLARVCAKLSNPQFAGRAPPAVIAQQEARRDELSGTRERLAALLKGWGG
jgi:valyl-tRNA synthetase